MSDQRKGLSLKTKLGFGVCDLGGNLFFTVIAFQLPIFLTDVVGLGAVLMGIALLIGRLWDAVTDPAMGHLSDITVSKWGRRRPYIFWGSFPMFVSMIVMFTAPGAGSQTFLFVWASVSLCFLATAFTVINIPYSALTPELTSDFNERTVLNGYRMSFAVVGTILGAGVALPLVSLFAEKTTGFTAMGAIFGFIMMVTALITFFTVKEPPHVKPVKAPSLLRSYRSALTNVPFIIIMIPWTLFILGVTVISGTVIYYFTYIYNAQELASIALMILLLVSLLCIPVWVKISKSIGKSTAYSVGMLILTAALMTYFFIGHLNIVYGYILMVFAGIGLSTHYVFPFALVPDVIEYDYAETGERKEGIYYGTWTFISKLGQALAGAIIGWVLAGYGYRAGEVQSPEAIFGIRLLVGPIPSIAFVIGVIVLSFYPIDKKKYAEILEKAAKREARNG